MDKEVQRKLKKSCVIAFKDVHNFILAVREQGRDVSARDEDMMLKGSLLTIETILQEFGCGVYQNSSNG